MRLIKLNPDFFKRCNDPELLQDHLGRPCVLLLRLKYKGRNMDFAVPLRSKMSPATPRAHYFPLPPSPTTPSGRIHGLHFAKMHPITNQYMQKYVTGDHPFSVVLSRFLDAHTKEIVTQAQEYLCRYEANPDIPFSVNIDSIASVLGL